MNGLEQSAADQIVNEMSSSNTEDSTASNIAAILVTLASVSKQIDDLYEDVVDLSEEFPEPADLTEDVSMTEPTDLTGESYFVRISRNISGRKSLHMDSTCVASHPMLP